MSDEGFQRERVDYGEASFDVISYRDDVERENRAGRPIPASKPAKRRCPPSFWSLFSCRATAQG